MKKLNIDDLRKLTLLELNDKSLDLQKKISLAKLNLKLKKLTDTSSVRVLRKDLARVKTVVNEIRSINLMKI